MPAPLLTTKLHIPAASGRWIARPRLVARLEEGRRVPLTLVSAPAGFGKTTLLCEWLNSSRAAVAWVSLDGGENIPARFWAYLLAALRTLHPWLPDLLDGPDLPPLEVLLAELVNLLGAHSQETILILDDYHVIDNPGVHTGLWSLLERAPDCFHLVLAGRADPPWPLARLRARRQLVELRAADLRFTPAEVTEWFQTLLRLDLAPQDLLALEERSEGWAAGLQMAALSLQGHPDPHAFVAAFTGSSRFIFDYLVEEVLHTQSPEIQEFLLKTALLERFNAGLCNTLLERSDSQAVLAQLERANLFIVPLDDTRTWYRYHHLFAGLLRGRVRQTAAPALPGLYRKASAGCEAAGLIEEAVAYAQAGSDLDWLLDLLERHCLDQLALGEFALVRAWLEGLPAAVVRSRAVLCVARTWLLPLADPAAREEAGQWMDAARIALDDPAIPDSTRGLVACNLAAFRVLAARAREQPPREVIALALEALEEIANRSPQLRSLLLANLGGCYLETGQDALARRMLEEAMRVGLASRNYNAAFSALNTRLRVAYLRGEFHEALGFARETVAGVLQELEQTGQCPPDSAAADALVGMILLERNDLPGARTALAGALEWFPRLQMSPFRAHCCLALARTLHALGEAEEIPDPAQGAIAYHPEFARRFAPSLAQIRLLRREPGQLELAQAWADQVQRDPPAHPVDADTALALARVRLAGPQPLDPVDAGLVLTWLAEALEEVRRLALNLTLIKIQIQRARLLHHLARPNEAVQALEEALRLAQPEGIVRPFLDEMDALAPLLADLLVPDLAEFIAGLLPASAPPLFQKERRSTGSPLEPLIEPLSERELEVLHLLATSLNTPEMAAHLYISVSTVRTHIKNIYAKLNVSRRIEAVQRAMELGLIERRLL